MAALLPSARRGAVLNYPAFPYVRRYTEQPINNQRPCSMQNVRTH